MAQDQWTLQGEKQKSTGARAASAVPRCSCQQGSPCSLRDDPGAHGNEQGAGKCKTERGKMDVGMNHGKGGQARHGK